MWQKKNEAIQGREKDRGEEYWLTRQPLQHTVFKEKARFLWFLYREFDTVNDD